MTKKILFIDDEPEFVRPQVIALEDVGYKVVLCSDSNEAIDLLQKQEYDLIILDLIMPPRHKNQRINNQEPDYAETGIKLHHEIREELGMTKNPIIFLTVVRDQDIRREIRDLERKYGQTPIFLTKPVRSIDVVAEVQHIFGDPQSTEQI